MRNTLCGLLTWMLVAGSVGPAAAQARVSADGEFGLGPMVALASEVPAGPVGSAAVENGTARKARLAEASRLSVGEAWRLAAQEVQADPAAPEKRGVGSWLKRRWWVPVLGGLALGALLIDEGGDNDVGGEDD